MSQKLFLGTDTQTTSPFKVNFVLITKTSGVPLYYQVIDPSGAPNDVTLLSGFTSAITSIFGLLQHHSKRNRSKRNAKLYYFGLELEKYYIYQKGDYLLCLSVSLFNDQEAMNPLVHNLVINIFEKMWKTFTLILKRSIKKENTPNEGEEYINDPKVTRMLKKRITEILSSSLGESIDNRYYLILEEIIEHYNFDEDSDIDSTISSLVQVFLSLLQE